MSPFSAENHNLRVVRQRERLAHAVATVLPAYGLAPQATFELISISENATYRVEDPVRGSFILRLHRSGYLRRQEILSELAWLDALRDAGLRVAKVIPTTSGECIASIYDVPLADERHCVLFELLPGAGVDRAGRVAWAEHVGELAARMHTVSDIWSPPSWFSRPSWDADTLIGAVARWGSWRDGPACDERRQALLERTSGVLLERLGALDPEHPGLGRVLVHADLRLANLLDADGEDVAIIDFDDMAWSWPVWDLVGYVRNMEGDPDLEAVVASWLRGYRGVRPMSEAATAALPTLMLAARLQVLGWIGTHPDTILAGGHGPAYLARTCELAEAYLEGG